MKTITLVIILITLWVLVLGSALTLAIYADNNLEDLKDGTCNDLNEGVKYYVDNKHYCVNENTGEMKRVIFMCTGSPVWTEKCTAIPLIRT